ncbi:MAG TPA: hypothetical protein VD741_02060 [Solirubrobacterales bacterium]|nr:hypothetical protein [Solirubrobacterales bacterium]
MPRGLSFPILCALLLTLLAGCGSDETGGPGTAPQRSQPATRQDAAPRRDAQPAAVAPSRCPAGAPECRVAEGRIVYVERIDPDGDGDAHFVIADPQGITLPGLTAIDVRKGLRPRPLPGPGDLISAAGPVQTGSYGQSQIHALELHVGR